MSSSTSPPQLPVDSGFYCLWPVNIAGFWFSSNHPLLVCDVIATPIKLLTCLMSFDHCLLSLVFFSGICFIFPVSVVCFPTQLMLWLYKSTFCSVHISCLSLLLILVYVALRFCKPLPAIMYNFFSSYKSQLKHHFLVKFPCAPLV